MITFQVIEDYQAKHFYERFVYKLRVAAKQHEIARCHAIAKQGRQFCEMYKNVFFRDQLNAVVDNLYRVHGIPND